VSRWRLRAFFLVLLFLQLSGCGLGATPRDKCMDRIISRTAKGARKEGLRYRGFGVASGVRPPYWVDQLTIQLGYSEFVNEEEARTLLLKIGRIMQNQIDSESCSDLLFKDASVNASHVGVVIFFGPDNGDKVIFPLIDVASLKRGKLTYRSHLSEESEIWDYEYSETLEEALEKLGEDQF